MPQKVGILGGTFDPVHFGHLRIAEEAAELLNLDTVLFIPAASPPHKAGKATLCFNHRRRMIELAIEGNPCFRLSDLEQRLPGVSYTVVTLGRLHEEMPSAELYFLVGLDAFLDLHTWWHFKELFTLARMVVLRRPGFHEEDVEEYLKERISPLYTLDPERDVFTHPHWLPVHYLKNTHLGISSTQIRQFIAMGRSIRYLVPREVMRYIRGENLYLPELLDSCGEGAAMQEAGMGEI